MAKRRGGFQGGGGGAPNMNQLMQQAQKMQRDIRRWRDTHIFQKKGGEL